MTFRIHMTILSLAILLSLPFAANASEVSIPNEFTDGFPASASEVNANFDAVQEAVNDNNEKINTKECVTCEGDVLDVPALKFAEKTGSVTYSALGFSPGVSRMSPLGDFTTEFNKSKDDGSLTITDNNDSNSLFFHNVTLRSGVTITQIRTLIQDRDGSGPSNYIVVRLLKATIANVAEVGKVSSEGDTSVQKRILIMDLDSPIIIQNWDSQPADQRPVSYIIEVKLVGLSARFYSVTIDYTYDEP